MTILFLSIPLLFSCIAVAYHFGQRSERNSNMIEIVIGSRVCSVLSKAIQEDNIQAEEPFDVVLHFERGSISRISLCQEP